MRERKYSVAEIDHMRVSVWRMERGGGLQSDIDNRVEAKLRTYMVAGVEPVELRAEADRGREGAIWYGANYNDGIRP